MTSACELRANLDLVKRLELNRGGLAARRADASYHIQVRPLQESEPWLADHALYSVPFADTNAVTPKTIPSNVRPGWQWRVRAMVNGAWTAWSEERTIWYQPQSEADGAKREDIQP